MEVVSVVIKYMDMYMPHSVNADVREWVAGVSVLSKGKLGLDFPTYMLPLLTLIEHEVTRVLLLKSVPMSCPGMSLEPKMLFEGTPAGNEAE